MQCVKDMNAIVFNNNDYRLRLPRRLAEETGLGIGHDAAVPPAPVGGRRVVGRRRLGFGCQP